MAATISRIADMWFISISVETKINSNPMRKPSQCGVDLGIKTLATLSNGQNICKSTSLKKHLKLKKISKADYHEVLKGSKNRPKPKISIAKLHYKVAFRRR